MDTNVGHAVVVGVDGSDEALRAVRWAADEAARQHRSLRVVTVFGWAEEAMLSPGAREQYRETLLDRSRATLTTAVSVAAEQQPGLEITHELRVGSPIAELVEESRQAWLLVVGDRGMGPVTGLLAGSVAVTLAAQAASPIVVVRGPEPAEPERRPVVLGVDGTPAGEAAIEFAYQAAAARRVPLLVVHSWTEAFAAPALTSLMYRGEDQAAEEELLAQRLAGWAEKYPDVHVDRLVVHDRAARVLIEKSQDAQLVVVGSRGHGEFVGLVLGSVSNALVHKAGCPVAVVRDSREKE